MWALMPHVSMNEDDHQQINDGIEDKDGADAEGGHGSRDQWANGGAEHAGALEKGEAGAMLGAGNDVVCRAEGERNCAAGEERQHDTQDRELLSRVNKDHRYEHKNTQDEPHRDQAAQRYSGCQFA